jgi:hypothetical protein
MVIFTTLYGTTRGLGSGTLFAINTDSTGFRVVHRFTPTYSPAYTNADGVNGEHGPSASSSATLRRS